MGLFQDQGLFDRSVSFSISRELSEQYNSLLQLISAQNIPLKNKLLGNPKLAASSLFFRVAQGLMGNSFGREDKSTVFHLLQSSELLAINLCWNGDYSSSFIQSHKLDKVPENQQKWFGSPQTFRGRRFSRIPPSQDL